MPAGGEAIRAMPAPPPSGALIVGLPLLALALATFAGTYALARYGPAADAIDKALFSAKAKPKRDGWKDGMREGARDVATTAERRYGVASRIVAELHNWVGIALGVSALGDAKLWADPLFAQNDATRCLIPWTTAYFIFDTVLVGYHVRAEGLGFLAHAVGCLFVYGNALVTGTHHIFGAAFVTWEISTFFLHVRWLLKEMGHDSGKLYALNGVILFVVFVLVRNVGGTYASVAYWRATAPLLASAAARRDAISVPTLWAYRVANVVLNALNALWSYKMFRGVASRFFGRAKARSKTR